MQIQEDNDQLEIFGTAPKVVHYFDRNGALHSGKFVRRITRGKRKGALVVRDAGGRLCIPSRIRNVEYADG